MKSLRTLKKRIKSIKNTSKITNALEMVSISKMKKFQDLALQSIEYSNEIAVLATTVAGIIENDKENINQLILNKYFEDKGNNKPLAIIVIAPTRGFCGSLISDMIKDLTEIIQENIIYKGVGIQKKAWYIMSKFSNISIESLFDKPVESPDFEYIRGPFEYVLGNYLKGDYSGVLLYFSEYRGSFDYEPTLKQLLPLKYSDLIEYIDSEEEKLAIKKDYIVEPNKNDVFEAIIERYLKTMFLYAMISSKASEHNARMIAMKNATDNANQLRNMLNLQYNKSRQELITTEMLDIIGGITK